MKYPGVLNQMSHLEAAKLDPRDRTAIEALITEFFELVDRGPTERLRELFTADGVVKALDIGVDVRGSQAIADFFGARTQGRNFPSRHSWASLRVLEVAPQEVRTSTIVVTYIGQRSGDTPKDFTVGNCEDVFRRAPDGQWRFAARNQVKIIS
jgi:ketosteroid isomerase-like protein